MLQWGDVGYGMHANMGLVLSVLHLASNRNSTETCRDVLSIEKLRCPIVSYFSFNISITILTKSYLTVVPLPMRLWTNYIQMTTQFVHALVSIWCLVQPPETPKAYTKLIKVVSFKNFFSLLLLCYWAESDPESTFYIISIWTYWLLVRTCTT